MNAPSLQAVSCFPCASTLRRTCKISGALISAPGRLPMGRGEAEKPFELINS
jgi:hypothetical protein